MDKMSKRSGLDSIINKLQYTPAEPEKKEPARTGSSKRKPAVTRHVLSGDNDSDDDFVDPPPSLIKADNSASTAVSETEDNADVVTAREELPLGVKEEVKPSESSQGEDNEDMKIEVNEEGTLMLPDGTVVVQPEPVPDDKPDHDARGRSRSSGSVKSIGTGSQDGDIGIVHCSSCGDQVNPSNKSNVRRHPVLKLLVCRRCYKYYTSGKITQDEDGIDEQCKLCGEGGKLLCCDFCTSTFCRPCVKRVLGRRELSTIDEADQWRCYCCDPSPLSEQITLCNAVFDSLEGKLAKEKLKDASMKQKRRGSVSSQGLGSDTQSDAESITEEVEKLANDTKRIGQVIRKKEGKTKNEAVEIWKRNILSKHSGGKGDDVGNLRSALKDIRAKAKLLEQQLEKYEGKSEKHRQSEKGKKRKQDDAEEEPQPSTSDGKRSRLDIECEKALLDEIKAMGGDSDGSGDEQGDRSDSDASSVKSNFSSDLDKHTRKKIKVKLQFGKHKKAEKPEESDEDSDPEIQFPKSPALKKKHKKGKSTDGEPHSSGHDSDLEEEIGCLERNVKNKYKSKKHRSKGKFVDSDGQVSSEDLPTEAGLESDSSKNMQGKAESKTDKKDGKHGKEKKKKSLSDSSSGSSSSSEEDDVTERESKRREKRDPNVSDSDQGLNDSDHLMDNDNDDFDQQESDAERQKFKQKDELDSSDDSDNEEAKRKLMEEIDDSDSSSDEDVGKKKKSSQEKKGKGKRQKSDESSNEGSDSDEENVKSKKSRRRNRLLARKLSESSDSEVGKKRSKKRTQDSSSDGSFFSSESSSSISDSSDSSVDFYKRKRRRGRKGRGRKRRNRSQSDTEDSKRKRSYNKKGKRRRRIKVADNSSESAESDESSESGENESTPKGKGRKKIRKVISKSKLQDETIRAAREEEERRKRIAQKRREVIQIEDESSPQKCPITTKLVLESDPETKEPIVAVNQTLVRKLKPHQVDAVQFIWDSCVESLEKLKKEDGGGCILAHCMGLGKTLSVFTFLHTLLSTRVCKVRSVLVVAPLNTVLNWMDECIMWLDRKDRVEVAELTSVRENWKRADALEAWHEDGGIMIMGYDMYRMLAKATRVKQKRLKRIFHECLVDPGPDIVVCDEGHILKNDASSISEALSNIRTRRRICLTGTPLQNNLFEYHCMVSFVKPSLLGTRKEFANRFANPINNGQHSDSTPYDVKLMKKRAHVLHDLLSGCVQRKDYSALTKFLPPKHEYVISVRLSDVQIKLYEHYLRTISSAPSCGGSAGSGTSLFSDYNSLMRIWTHPYILRLGTIREQNRTKYYDSDSMDDFIAGSDENSTSQLSDNSVIEVGDSDDSEKRKKKLNGKGKGRGYDSDSSVEVVNTWKSRTRGKDGNNLEEEETETKVVPGLGETESKEWYSDFVNADHAYNLELSGKLCLLMEILRLSEEIGDKILVFSQSLLSLDIIEDFLEYIENKAEEAKDGKEPHPILKCCGNGAWVKNIDYYRMDGSTNAHNRKRWCEIFNDPTNLRARLFLISTKAGSLGINLIAANRVIIFDASWNPTHDVQSIFRVYRFGQEKACYVYRFLAQGTMEEKIYERQIIKQSLSQRVVDEHQINRHFTSADLAELYNFSPDIYNPDKEQPTPMLPKDYILAELLTSKKEWILKFHEHDSLLENIISEELSEEDRRAAWAEYNAEKEGRVQRPAVDPELAMRWMQQQRIYQQQQQQQQQQAQQQQHLASSQMYEHLQRLLSNGATLLTSGERILQSQQQPGYLAPFMREDHLRRLQQAQAQFAVAQQQRQFATMAQQGTMPRTNFSATVREILQSWPMRPSTQRPQPQDGGTIE
ncbi:transcriptional regulator ATRX homolog [Ptychodera flava]|uniref:transcriptional regulator ATRX homolog n=1 Tax=Ptychodera flava TaxID=63121 RepID=UPI00396A0261